MCPLHGVAFNPSYFVMIYNIYLHIQGTIKFLDIFDLYLLIN